MATEVMTVFVFNMEENDEVMIGGEPYQVIYKAEMPQDGTRYFQLHHKTTPNSMFMTMNENATITIRRPIK